MISLPGFYSPKVMKSKLFVEGSNITGTLPTRTMQNNARMVASDCAQSKMYLPRRPQTARLLRDRHPSRRPFRP